MGRLSVRLEERPISRSVQNHRAIELIYKLAEGFPLDPLSALAENPQLDLIEGQVSVKVTANMEEGREGDENRTRKDPQRVLQQSERLTLVVEALGRKWPKLRTIEGGHERSSD
jgi:hypothetical protein